MRRECPVCVSIYFCWWQLLATANFIWMFRRVSLCACMRFSSVSEPIKPIEHVPTTFQSHNWSNAIHRVNQIARFASFLWLIVLACRHFKFCRLSINKKLDHKSSLFVAFHRKPVGNAISALRLLCMFDQAQSVQWNNIPSRNICIHISFCCCFVSFNLISLFE